MTPGSVWCQTRPHLSCQSTLCHFLASVTSQNLCLLPDRHPDFNHKPPPGNMLFLKGPPVFKIELLSRYMITLSHNLYRAVLSQDNCLQATCLSTQDMSANTTFDPHLNHPLTHACSTNSMHMPLQACQTVKELCRHVS